MLENTRRPIHIGVNFVLTVPTPLPLDTKRQLGFQSRLARDGIEIAQSNRQEREINFISPPSEPLQIRVVLNTPQVAQLLIVSPNPAGDLEMFVRRAEAVCSSFREVWPEPRLSLSRDATIRHLYQSEGEHAFKFIWERRLCQKNADFATIGRPVLGGGLRLVLPATSGLQSQIEVRVESFLMDSRMLFVETQQTWPFPLPVDEALQPKQLLEETQAFATTNVVRFIKCGLVSDKD
jgi:hypothetical protein